MNDQVLLKEKIKFYLRSLNLPVAKRVVQELCNMFGNSEYVNLREFIEDTCFALEKDT